MIKIHWVIYSLILWTLTPNEMYAQDDHGHTHEEIGGADSNRDGAEGVFSVYAESQKYELSLKHGHIEPGHETELILYIADYFTNAPLSEIDLRIEVKEDSSIHIETEYVEPGIYHLNGQFPQATPYSLIVNLNSKVKGADLLLLAPVEVGVEPPHEDEVVAEEHEHGSSWWKYALVFLGGLGIGYLILRRRPKVAVAILVVISVHAVMYDAQAHEGHDEVKKTTAGNEAFIPKETQFLFKVLTQPVATGDFKPSIELFGTVIPSPSGFANITTPQTGKVTSLNVMPGQKVTKGQTLAVVVPSTSLSDQVGVATETGRLRADIQAAQAELTAAEKELNRLRSIADIAAKKDVQAAEARYAAAKSNLQSLRSISSGSVTGTSGSVTLKAPVSGTIGQFSLATGAEIISGTTLFSITNLDKVYIEAQVYDQDADLVRNASSYTVQCTDENHETAEVRLVSDALEVNASNQSHKVIFELHNPEGEFKIGEFVTLQAFQNQVDKTLFIPNSALSEISGKPVVYVKDGPEKYSVRYISPGEDNGTHTVVLQGLQEKERYVTNGAYQVKMMMLNQ